MFVSRLTKQTHSISCSCRCAIQYESPSLPTMIVPLVAVERKSVVKFLNLQDDWPVHHLMR